MVHLPIREETLELRTGGGDTITGDLRYPEERRNCPIVVICHSFMAFKDWGFFPHIGRTIAESGFATFAFNFSWDGVAGSGNRITEFERFQQNTFSKEVRDCDRVIDAIQSGELADGRTDKRVVMMGHSRGGGMAILTASRRSEVCALATMAAVSTFNRWTEHQKVQWRERGYLPLSRGTAASPLRLGTALLDDLEQHAEEYNLLRAASAISVPWLILHGATDLMVPLREAEALYAAADKSKTELISLEHVGHLFSAASPDEDGYATLNHTLDIITSWLHTHF